MTVRVLSHEEARARLYGDEWAEPPIPFLSDEGRTRLEAFIKDNHIDAYQEPVSEWQREVEDRAKALGPGITIIARLQASQSHSRRAETLDLVGEYFDWTLTTKELEIDDEPPSPAPV